MARLFPDRRRGATPMTRFWPPRRRSPLGRIAFAARPLVLLAVLLLAWTGLDPALVDPPGFLSSAPERVDQRFTRCGPRRGPACVIDGDTFKLGQRKVRIIGIDAPEMHGQCPHETRAGRAGDRGAAGKSQSRPVRDGRADRPLHRPLRPRLADPAAPGAEWRLRSDCRRDARSRPCPALPGGFKLGWCD